MPYRSRTLTLALALSGTALLCGSREKPIVLDNACDYKVKVVFRIVENKKEREFFQVVEPRNVESVDLGASFKYGDPNCYLKSMMIAGTERKLPDGTVGNMWFETKSMKDNLGKPVAGPVNRPWHFLITNKKENGKDLPSIETFQVSVGKALRLTD